MKNLRLPSRALVLAGVLAIAVPGILTSAEAQTTTKRTIAPKPAMASAENSVALNRVLVFSRTKGYRHGSIPVGKLAIMKLGQENGFAVDTTEDATKFTEANLKKYSAVVWLSTTGDVLDDAQQAAFEQYIQAGGGYAGIHAAADTEYGWPWYNQLAGAWFLNHPKQQNAEIEIVDKNHPSTKMLPDRWKRWDEWYSYKNIGTDLKVLGKLDEKTYEGGKNGDNHPFIWYHDFDGGKAFYTGGGHTDESYADPLFLQHILGGIKSVMATSLKFGQVKTQPFPEENRFEQQVLIQGMDEPTELAVLDNGKILFAQRKGELKVYDPQKKSVKTVANFPVFTKFEYGLMGLNVDPNFKQNKWIYAYYSPVTGNTVADTAQHLSRFVYDDVKDTLLLNTEKVLLTIPVKRDGCCHTGGSIAWDRKGNLYLSTGDDTNPFNSDGYAPIDERPNRRGWDARATSSNTNDLRGKIVRIHPEADGTYSIPEGNLFPKGNPKARAEIYVMGNRNPYRISVDQHTGFLYWGEVGPDAGTNSDKYGPRGHDEMNQARQAGYFGWPLFVADNRPYNQRTFADSTTGPLFDPMKPINNSPNNTGLTELPPAQKAYIYYPYADSPEFGDIVGKGGRNAMGGPVYYFNDYPATSSVKFPQHYDGKFFAYDWIRDWVHPVTMKENGDFVKMETFMPSTKFSHIIDMQFANDGSLYTVEYGQKWFGANSDARLSRITYNAGNRKPVAVANSNKTVGAAPLVVKFDSKGSLDYDGDALKYEWSFGKGMSKQMTANPTVTFTKPGVYPTTLTVTDAAGHAVTKTMEIKVGNAEPQVEVAVAGNKTFYFPDKPVKYAVKVIDKEDGTLQKGISPDDVTMTIDYLEGFDKTMLAQGHQANAGFSTGKRMMELSDCKACHSIDQKSIGPAYLEVAKKYKGAQVEGKLARKIISGGGGVWGEQAMSAHPQLKESEATDMVRYILSLADDKPANRQPIAGDYVPVQQKKDGSYILTASYTDRGNGLIGPLTGSTSMALRSPSVKAVSADVKQDIFQYDIPTLGPAAVGLKSGSYLEFSDIDLTGIQGITASIFAANDQVAGGKLEVRLDSPTGTLLGEGEAKLGTTGPLNLPFRQPASGVHKLYFIFVNPTAGQKALFALDKVQFSTQGM